MQGSNRFQRGLLYAAYLDHVFHSDNSHAVVATFEGGHCNACMYASAAFKSWAYSD